jgi:hypothetical protein
MKAIQYRAYGDYAENKFVDLPAPAANDGQVLVRLPRGTYAAVGYAGGREAGINLTDIIWKAAKVQSAFR